MVLIFAIAKGVKQQKVRGLDQIRAAPFRFEMKGQLELLKIPQSKFHLRVSIPLPLVFRVYIQRILVLISLEKLPPNLLLPYLTVRQKQKCNSLILTKLMAKLTKFRVAIKSMRQVNPEIGCFRLILVTNYIEEWSPNFFYDHAMDQVAKSGDGTFRENTYMYFDAKCSQLSYNLTQMKILIFDSRKFCWQHFRNLGTRAGFAYELWRCILHFMLKMQKLLNCCRLKFLKSKVRNSDLDFCAIIVTWTIWGYFWSEMLSFRGNRIACFRSPDFGTRYITNHGRYNHANIYLVTTPRSNLRFFYQNSILKFVFLLVWWLISRSGPS